MKLGVLLASFKIINSLANSMKNSATRWTADGFRHNLVL
jgi:hypothetical protein